MVTSWLSSFVEAFVDCPNLDLCDSGRPWELGILWAV